MITETAIQEAIAYCQGKIDPKREDAVLLAACYILQDHLFPQPGSVTETYSLAPPPSETIQTYSAEPETVGEYGDSDFLRAIAGKEPAAMWHIMDDLMDTLKLVNERSYNSVMRKIR